MADAPRKRAVMLLEDFYGGSSAAWPDGLFLKIFQAICEAEAAAVAEENEACAKVARNLAVELVDGVFGYTCEFAPSYTGHTGHYDWCEEKIADAIRARQAKED